MSPDVAVSDPALDAPSLVWLDPATLVAHPANVRDGLGDVSELATSIALTGVVEPLVIIPQGDWDMRILAEHRRAAAAVAAGLDAVPCLVRADLAGADDEQLAAALAENIQRRGLSPQEEARAYAQLCAFPGWSAGRIAQATGRDELSVRRSIEASTLAPEFQPAAISGQLSLEDAPGRASRMTPTRTPPCCSSRATAGSVTPWSGPSGGVKWNAMPPRCVSVWKPGRSHRGAPPPQRRRAEAGLAAE